MSMTDYDNAETSVHYSNDLIYDVGGWGGELNRELDLCRACVRAVCMSREVGVQIYGR